MISFQKVTIPADGEKIEVKDEKLIVPDFPIVLFIEGDGIGPDIWKASKEIFNEAVKVVFSDKKKVKWTEIFAGEKALKNYGEGNLLPDETIEAIKNFKVAIKGPLTTPVGKGFRSLNVTLRQKLDLYACIRPCRWLKGTPSPVKAPEKLDVIVFRENTEDVYAGIEWHYNSEEVKELKKFLKEKYNVLLGPETGIGIKPISRFCSRRLVRKALKYALTHNKGKITLVHKGNIMKYTEGAFREWGYELAGEELQGRLILEEELNAKYDGKIPEGRILINDRIADSMFQQILLRPDEYDILATTNLNGDYLSDACAAQVGGLGMAPGANISDDIFIFEATHGTAPKYANLNKVNPGSLILSGVMMFQYMGWNEVADIIYKSLEDTVQEKTVTYDLARMIEGAKEVSTCEFAGNIIKNIKRRAG